MPDMKNELIEHENDSCKCERNHEQETEQEGASIDVEIDDEAFNAGSKSMSELCGKVAALVAVGVTPDQALAYFCEMNSNEMTCKANLEIIKTQSKTQIECAHLGVECS